MLLDLTQATFAPVIAAEAAQNQLMSLPANRPLLAYLYAMDKQCCHPGLALVADPARACVYAYFRPLDASLDSHPADKFWQFQTPPAALPESADDLATEALTEIQRDSLKLMKERGVSGNLAVAYPLGRSHADSVSKELTGQNQSLVELPDWSRLAPAAGGLCDEVCVVMATLQSSADKGAAELRLVTDMMPEFFRHVTAFDAAFECVHQSGETLRREMTAGVTVGDLPTPLMLPPEDRSAPVVFRMSPHHSDRFLSGLALLLPSLWCPALLEALPGRSLVAVFPDPSTAAVCSPHDHAATAALSLTLLEASASQVQHRLLSRPVRYQAETRKWSYYEPDAGKQEFPVPTNRPQWEDYVVRLSARQQELSCREGLTRQSPMQLPGAAAASCHSCGEAPASGGRLLACAGACGGRRLYCGRICQKADWRRRHKAECGRL